MELDALIGRASHAYGFEQGACRFLAGGREAAKRLYTFSLQGKHYILRLVKNADECQTLAEMDWLRYLASRGVGVPAPLAAKNGALAIPAKVGGAAYVMAAYSMLPGRKWNKDDPALWGPSVLYAWGRAVGELHRETKGYRPAETAPRRGEFSIRQMIGGGCPAAEAVLAEIEALPKDAQSYGLIHNDLHPDNFLIDGRHAALFDFDGCAYSWFAFDIGNALYLALWMGRSNTAGEDFTQAIVRHFLEGYLCASRLAAFWLERVPLFMMACKIALFSHGCDSEAPGQMLDEAQRTRQLEHIESKILFPGMGMDSELFRLGQ